MIKRLIIGFWGVSVIAVLVVLLGSESAKAEDLYRCIPTAADIKDGKPYQTTHCSPFKEGSTTIRDPNTLGKLHCEYTISGQSRHGCFSADPGSTLFTVELFSVPGSLVGKGCEDDETCLALRCSVFGTVQLEDGGTCDPTTLDPDCGVAGTAFCRNHGGNSSTAEGQPFTLDTFLSATGSFEKITKTGRTKETVTTFAVLPDSICQNRNWKFLTFVPSIFNGGCCTCDGGFDTDIATPGDCCADDQRNGDGSCVLLGNESCNELQCTFPSESFDPLGPNDPYQCGPIPQPE